MVAANRAVAPPTSATRFALDGAREKLLGRALIDEGLIGDATQGLRDEVMLIGQRR
mgnify:CR=1 FL=1